MLALHPGAKPDSSLARSVWCQQKLYRTLPHDQRVVFRRSLYGAMASVASMRAARHRHQRLLRRARVRDSEGRRIDEPRYDPTDPAQVSEPHVVVQFEGRPFGVVAYAPGRHGRGALVWELSSERYPGDPQGRARKAGVCEGHAVRRINGQDVANMDFWDIMDLLADKVFDNSSGKFQSGAKGPSGHAPAELPAIVELVPWREDAKSSLQPSPPPAATGNLHSSAEACLPSVEQPGHLRYTQGMEVTETFIMDLLALMQKHAGEVVLSMSDAMRLVQDVTALLQEEDTLCRCQFDQITVVGDLHGQFFDMLQIFDLAGMPSDDNPYMFNGDFVDRGQHSLEVILTLFALKLRYPSSVRMNRGNHEAADLNLRYGFAAEIRERYGHDGEQLFHSFSEAFRWLPLAHVLNDEVFVVHGGLPGPDPRLAFADAGGGGTGYDAAAVSSQDGRVAGRKGGGQHLSLLGYNPDNVSLPPRTSELTLEAIGALPRGGEPATDLKALGELPEEEAEVQRNIVDLLWADPRGKTGYGPSFRVQKGCYIFGPDVTEAFLKKNGLRLVLRSHEVKVDGFQWTHDNLLTVFSAPNYLGHAKNRGAVVRLERAGDQGHLTPSFITYEAHASMPTMV
mmetsp:Transcript_51024/g.114854  ORF Transcript_51024/g.114854 Transcript_51024/m.114854 type:complete len:623 (-) Transcript_51024:68-1936(-)